MKSRTRDKVMLVDDDEVVLQSLTIGLEARGYTVVTRSQSIGTGAAILTERPEIVVLDVQMPGLSGDALLQVLKGKSGFPMPWVVLHSSLPVDELLRIARSANAAGTIVKSDVRTFLDAFEALLTKLRRDQGALANSR
ncbi:MAG: response regulator [Polyangiaceae bacterium]|nr:response regulator [Polyangiaceae bacterium]